MLKIFSKIYEYFIKRRNSNFDNGNIAIFKAKAKVISVGNISIGGSGKTPIVIAIAKYLISKGKKVAIVGSGYKRRSKGLIIVSNYNKILSDVGMSGDEMYLIAQSVPNSVVIADKRKVDAVKYADEFYNPDIIIIDDGFQHRYVYRDIDLVIIDRRTNEESYTLPYGRLREPIESIQRADAIILRDEIEIGQRFKDNFENKPIIKSNTILKQTYFLNNQEKYFIKSEKLSIITVCGLALQDNFLKFVTDLKFNIEYSFNFKDHFKYNSKSIKQLIKKCKQINVRLLISTEKDAVKLIDFIQEFENEKIEVLVLPIAIEFNPKNELFKLIDELYK